MLSPREDATTRLDSALKTHISDILTTKAFNIIGIDLFHNAMFAGIKFKVHLLGRRSG